MQSEQIHTDIINLVSYFTLESESNKDTVGYECECG